MPKDNSGKGKAGKHTRKTDKNQDREDDQPEHIPRPPNSWILFRRHFNEQLQLEQQASTSRNQQQVSGDASTAWKALSKQERAYWDRKAEEAKAEHLLRYPGYRYKPRKKKQTEKNAASESSGSLDPQAPSNASTLLVHPQPPESEPAPPRRRRARQQSTPRDSNTTSTGAGWAVPTNTSNLPCHNPAGTGASPEPSGSMEPRPSSSMAAFGVQPQVGMHNPTAPPRRRRTNYSRRQQSTPEASSTTTAVAIAGPSSRTAPNTVASSSSAAITHGMASIPGPPNAQTYHPPALPHRLPFVPPSLPLLPTSYHTSSMPPFWETANALSPVLTDESQEFSPEVPQGGYTHLGIPIDWQVQGSGPQETNLIQSPPLNGPISGVESEDAAPMRNTANAQSGSQDPQGEESELDALFDRYINYDFGSHPQ